MVEVHKGFVFISREDKPFRVDTNDVWLASLARTYLQQERTQRNLLAVGDRVLCRPALPKEGSGIPSPEEVEEEDRLPRAMVVHRAPRGSWVARQDPMVEGREHVLAANPTQLVVVASFLHPEVKWGLVDRYLVLAEEQDLKVTLIFNKADLLAAHPNSTMRETYQGRVQWYASLGYRVLQTVGTDPLPKQVDLLEGVFRKEISLLSGHSGVGKSSLINLLDPEIIQDVESGAIFKKGRHTTTYASFIKLGACPGYVIDTPGIRSFVIAKREPFDLAYGFREFRPLFSQCRYRSGCHHHQETSCAVKDAVEKRGDPLLALPLLYQHPIRRKRPGRASPLGRGVGV